MDVNLPAIPDPPSRGSLTLRAAIDLEQRVATALPSIANIDLLQDAQARLLALEAYLSKKGIAGPAMGAARRIEARIGELLGPPRLDHDRSKGTTSVGTDVDRQDRSDFRRIAVLAQDRSS